MHVHIFSSMNCVMESSILGSKNALQYVSLLLNKKDFNEIVKYTSMI